MLVSPKTFRHKPNDSNCNNDNNSNSSNDNNNRTKHEKIILHDAIRPSVARTYRACRAGAASQGVGVREVVGGPVGI